MELGDSEVMRGYPQFSSMFIGWSIINHPLWVSACILWNHPQKKSWVIPDVSWDSMMALDVTCRWCNVHSLEWKVLIVIISMWKIVKVLRACTMVIFLLLWTSLIPSDTRWQTNSSFTIENGPWCSSSVCYVYQKVNPSWSSMIFQWYSHGSSTKYRFHEDIPSFGNSKFLVPMIFH